MAKETEISLKSTKAEIFQAFEQMKEKYKQQEKEKLHPAQESAAQKEEAKIVEKTLSYSPENLENEVISLRKKMQHNLDDIMNQLTTESEKLQDLRKAMKIETKKLEEIYNIELAADTLKILIADYETKQKELQEKRAMEKAAIEKEITDKKRAWEREQEEYKYNLKVERKRDEENYEIEQAKKRADWEEEVSQKETELAEREDGINRQEQEIIDMRKQIERFPKKLESIVQDVKHKKEKHLKHEFAHEKQLLEQKWLAEKGVFEVKINNLQNIINNQEMEIKSLKNSLTEANQRAQGLAVTVVEGASAMKQLKQEKEAKEKERDDKKEE